MYEDGPVPASGVQPDLRPRGRGRTADFEELVHAEHVRLFRALALITRDPAEAEDVMQEAFLRVWERWGRAPSLADPPAYLYRTALNIYRSRRRRGFTALRRAMGLHLPRPGTHDAPRGRPGSLPATATGGRPHT
jgi:DNA-directed RNA polymerase specialized sigma24 family protein